MVDLGSRPLHRKLPHRLRRGNSGRDSRVRRPEKTRPDHEKGDDMGWRSIAGARRPRRRRSLC